MDIRYTLRTLARRPGFTAAIVLTLALGIGANTAVFSVVSGVLIRPLPYPEPERLAVLWLRSPGINIPQDWPSPGQYIDVRTENHSFQEMSISQGGSGTLINGDRPERAQILRTSSSLFHLLGARPHYGRLLLPEEDRPGKAPVVVLSHAFWTRVFAADPTVVGRTITLNGLGQGPNASNQFEVVGVLSRDFLMNDEIMLTVGSIKEMDVFVPLPLGDDAVKNRGDENYNLMARLKPGVTMEQARAGVAAIGARIREEDRRDKTFTIDTVGLLDQVVGDVRRPVLVLLGSVGLVLLIACANVANLMLTRAAGRHREVAIRTALGADWTRVARQLLTESTVIALMGGAAGLLIAKWSLDVARAINPGNIPRLDAIAIDGRVLAFTFGVSLVTGIVFGLAPALRARRVDMNDALKAGGRGVQGEAGLSAIRFRARSLLVVSEVALSVMLLIGAGLLIRSFVRLQGVPPGFNPERVISLRLGVTGQKFQDRAAAVKFYQELSRKIAAVPGVTAQGAVSVLPFTSGIGWGGINVEGWTPKPGEELQVDRRSATPDYFRTMGIPLVAGRFFTEADAETSPATVAIVDEKFARRFWPNTDPIGKHIWNNPERKLRIVGVVGTVKQYGLDIEGRIVAYGPGLSGYQVARVAGDIPSATSAIVKQIHDVDPTVPIFDVKTMPDRVSDSLARQRFSAIMLAAFAGFAMLLATIGVYGVMSYQVTQSTRDIGMRIALGADRGSIVGLVVRQGMTLALAGIAIGVAGAWGLTRLMSSLLFGVSAFDLTTFAAVPLLLLAVALVAVYLPARRAATIDPAVAFRYE